MEISKELAQAILNYLTTKPFQEVYVLINELQKQALVKPDKKDSGMSEPTGTK